MFKVLGIASGLIPLIGILPYVRDILRKTTKPERASWFIWMVLGGIAFFSQLSKGATNSLWLAGMSVLSVTIVFLLALRYGEGGLDRRDVIALIVSFFGLVLWYLTKDATIALLLVIAVDTSGSVLTTMKAYEDPGSETMITWFLDGIAGLLSAISVGAFNWILLVYPLYICVANLAVVGAMLLGKKKPSK